MNFLIQYSALRDRHDKAGDDKAGDDEGLLASRDLRSFGGEPRNPGVKLNRARELELG